MIEVDGDEGEDVGGGRFDLVVGIVGVECEGTNPAIIDISRLGG